MRFYSDDPARDASDYYSYLETKKAMWESRCVKCEICHEPIDPDEDVHSLNLTDRWVHVQCFNSMVDKSNIPENFKDYIKESAEETYYDYTPVPEGI